MSDCRGARRGQPEISPARGCPPGLSTATGTAAPKVNMVILDGELARIDPGPGYPVQPRVLQVGDCAAIQANQVMMLVDFSVKASGRTRVTSFGYDPERHESAQDAVHRHAGNLRQTMADRPVHLLSRWMILSLQDRFKHGAALDGNRQPPLAVGGYEPIKPSLLVKGTHLPEMNICSG